ncbi:hypothetical protein DM02DRAFT_596304 [Periconia macrospinosa]|uniref:Zn(2)-C6 fungal-type domain-containing protein n=1 Tax=Periconia macrospinosa TaxID=97972 RepID=A0A2V1DJC6_9PLEO|nr:hypothetical protein DM02DRAFT_596304 [Periconia macrospinosa]
MLQQAETDGTGPVKKRRPALSCMECRRRKVKCDRERPCGPCIKTKSPTCTYRTQPKGRWLRSPTTCEQRTSEHGGSLLSMSSRHTASDSQGATEHSSSPNGERIVSELTERLRHLEGQLAAVNRSETGSSSSRSQPAENVYNRAPSTYFVKSKFFGESHWLNCLEPVSSANICVNPSTNRTEVDSTSELYNTVAECKRMARTIKATRMFYPTITTELQASVPSKIVCDQLVQCYLRTLEGVIRVLHIPSFLREYETYWKNTESAKPSVLIKILLVCAIGVAFFTGPEQPRLHASSTKWIQAAESWLSAPHQKSRLNMAGLQIHILLLLARQLCSVDGDLIWISAGSLLRTAMHIGLHRDPQHFQNISKFHVEMRRRLWATVMEMTVQSSLDMGMPPMISTDEFDTQAPSNINDSELDAPEETPFLSKSSHEFTQTSMQIAFYETLPLRLEITKLLNNIRSTPSYEDTLRLAKDLLSYCHRYAKFHQAAMNNATSITRPNAFQNKLFDTLIRRFALCLHRPFFNKAKHQPEYYYSRKMCLDLSVIIATPATTPGKDQDDDWNHLYYHGVGFFKSFSLHSLSVVYLELISQLEDQESMALYTPHATAPIDGGTSQVPLPPQLEVYRDIVVRARNVAKKRLLNGETNAKGYTWLCASVARIDALARNCEPDAAVLAAAKSAVAEVEEIMRAAYFAENGTQIDLSRRRGSFAGRDQSRGEGADDITATPRVVELDEAWDEEPNDLTGFTEDMEWENLMRDDTLGIGWGFEGNPESWFGWGGNYGAPNTMF